VPGKHPVSDRRDRGQAARAESVLREFQGNSSAMRLAGWSAMRASTSASQAPHARPGQADVFDYIERFYKPRRRHSTISYISPMEFEQRARSA
jgi:transposase InsO family protein